MQSSPFFIRNYQREDFSALKSLLEFARTEFPLELQLSRPGFLPEKDLFLALDQQGIISGYACVTWEANIKRTILEIFVTPEKRGRGIGSILLSQVVERSREQRAFSAHIVVQEEFKSIGSFLQKRGFKKVRTYLDLVKNLTDFKPVSSLDNEFSFSYLQPGDEAELADLQNSIFASSWGYCPNSPEEIAFYLKATGCRLQDVLVLEQQGDPAGYLWPQYSTEQSRIHMCGILPAFRGKGWGSALLLKGLENFCRLGTRKVALTVDDKNYAAVKLYTGLGFMLSGRQFWWEQILDPGG